MPDSHHSYATGSLVRAEGELKLRASSSYITGWHYRVSTPSLLCLSSIFQDFLFPFLIVLICFSLWPFTWHVLILFRACKETRKPMRGHHGQHAAGDSRQWANVQTPGGGCSCPSFYWDYSVEIPLSCCQALCASTKVCRTERAAVSWSIMAHHTAKTLSSKKAQNYSREVILTHS